MTDHVEIIKKAHRIKLNPTEEQAAYFQKAAAAARKVWNWALAEVNEHSKANDGKLPKITGKGDTLKARFTQMKKTEEWAWTSEVTTYATQQAFIDLNAAIRRYFDLKKKGELKKPKDWKGRKDGKPYGWPRFKSWRHTTPAFYEANIGIRFNGHFVTLPKIGSVNMAEEFRWPDARILGGRISYRQGCWWLSVQAEVEHEPQCGDGAVGVDLGIKYLAVTSDGEILENPRALRKALKKLRRLQRKLDRQRRANNPDNFNDDGTAKRGVTWTESNRMAQTKAAITKLHARIAHIRQETAHEFTTDMIRNNQVVGVEDLNIKGMIKNKRLAKDIADAGLYEKRRQLEYKASQNGAVVVPVSRWFASSKTCNGCGWVYAGLTLSERKWTCQECGQVNERDGNAAKNIRDEAIRILENE